MRVILPSGRYLCREENSKWNLEVSRSLVGTVPTVVAGIGGL